MSPEELRRLIREKLPVGIEAMAKILEDDNASKKHKIDAFNSLADRGGVPAVKAAVTQTINSKLTLEELEEQRIGLIEEQKAITTELKELKAGGVEEAKLNRTNALPRPNIKKDRE